MVWRQSWVEQIDLPRIQGVIRRHDLNQALLDPILQYRFGFANLFGHASRVCDHAVVDPIPRLITGCFD